MEGRRRRRRRRGRRRRRRGRREKVGEWLIRLITQARGGEGRGKGERSARRLLTLIAATRFVPRLLRQPLSRHSPRRSSASPPRQGENSAPTIQDPIHPHHSPCLRITFCFSAETRPGSSTHTLTFLSLPLSTAPSPFFTLRFTLLLAFTPIPLSRLCPISPVWRRRARVEEKLIYLDQQRSPSTVANDLRFLRFSSRKKKIKLAIDIYIYIYIASMFREIR